jgi:putative Ig domain-containing protein
MRTIRRIPFCSAFLLTILIAAYFVSALYAAPLPLTLNEPATTLPEAKAGSDYSHQFQAEGGLAPLTWRVKQGDLPAGIGLEASGKLHGKPAQARREPYSFVIEVSDSSQPPQSFSQTFVLAIQAAPLRIVTGQPSSQPELRIVSVPSDRAALPAANLMRAEETGSPNNANGNGSTGGSTKATHKVSGRLRPASLDEAFARIQSDPEIIKDPGVKNHLCRAGFSNHCPSRNGTGGEQTIEEGDKGEQKAATIKLLSLILEKEEWLSRFLSGSSVYPRLSQDTLNKLILMLNNYIDNITVRVELDDKLVATAMTDKGGFYEVRLEENDDGKSYVLSTEADNYLSKRKVVVADSDLKVNLPIEDRPVNLLARAVVGYQQAGAASADFEQNYFFDLFVSQSLPFLQKINPDFGERWRAWGAIRAISAPQSGDVTIGGLANGLVTNISNLKANEAARVFDYLGGLEVRMPGFSNSSLLPSFDRDTKQKFSLSFIASGGFITPTSPTQTVNTFKISDQFRTEYEKTVGGAELRGKDYVAFVQSDRDRFFRQYYAGIRMQTFYFNRHNVPLQRFPAQLDLQFGVNEYVTAGRVRGGVIRLDGYFPLPYENLKFINLFGTWMIRPVRSKVTNTLILEPVNDNEQIRFDPQTAILPVSQFNRDYYRIGVGIDFVSFMGKLLKNN